MTTDSWVTHNFYII